MTSDEFIRRCLSSAGDLALLFAFEPDQKMLAALARTRQNLTVELTDVFGTDVAARIADAFCTAVIGRKAELEKMGASEQIQSVRS